MSISALLACFSFYSGLYLIYFFFAQQQNPLFFVFSDHFIDFCLHHYPLWLPASPWPL